MSTDWDKKSQMKYHCEICYYNTCNKKDYRKHLLTSKHINQQKSPKIPKNCDDNFICNCGKTYKQKCNYEDKICLSGQSTRPFAKIEVNGLIHLFLLNIMRILEEIR